MQPTNTVLVSVDLLKRIGRVIDDVVTFEYCTCGDGGGCANTCLYSQANTIQDELIGLKLWEADNAAI